MYGMSLKCGSTSIQKALQAEGYTRMERDCRIGGCNVVLVVRHPLERFVSCWTFFTKTYHRTGPTTELTVNKDISLADYFEFTKQNPDPHWDTQASQHPNWKRSRLIALEDLDEMWPKYGFGKIGHTRTSVHAAWDTYYSEELRSKVLCHYAEDYNMWWKAIKKTHSVTFVRANGRYICMRINARQMSSKYRKRNTL